MLSCVTNSIANSFFSLVAHLTENIAAMATEVFYFKIYCKESMYSVLENKYRNTVVPLTNLNEYL